jgi:ribonuclease HI
MKKVIAYTDGACHGNPGPMGAGAVLLTPDADRVKQISQSLGAGTNNIAELQAVSLALSGIKQYARSTVHITIRTDSQYVIGMLSKGWKMNANVTLVMAIRELITQFGLVEFEKIKAHTGNQYNEWADNLAQQGVKGNEINTYV